MNLIFWSLSSFRTHHQRRRKRSRISAESSFSHWSIGRHGEKIFKKNIHIWKSYFENFKNSRKEGEFDQREDRLDLHWKMNSSPASTSRIDPTYHRGMVQSHGKYLIRLKYIPKSGQQVRVSPFDVACSTVFSYPRRWRRILDNVYQKLFMRAIGTLISQMRK